MTSPEILYTKIVVNELGFLPVTHPTYFDIRFDRCEFLKSGFSVGQILDRLVYRCLVRFLGQKWVRHAGVYIQDMKITCPAFRHLLKHTFSLLIAMVMAISVPPRAELAVCWKIALSKVLRFWHNYGQR
jgi:hypothetical protein